MYIKCYRVRVKQVLNICELMLLLPLLASYDRLVNPWVLPA